MRLVEALPALMAVEPTDHSKMALSLPYIGTNFALIVPPLVVLETWSSLQLAEIPVVLDRLWANGFAGMKQASLGSSAPWN